MRVVNNASIVKWHNSGFVTRRPQFDSELKHHFERENMEEKLGVEAINAAANEILIQVNRLRYAYIQDAEASPEDFVNCTVEDAYVWFAEGLF